MRRRRFHFTSPPLKDPALLRFHDWSEENRGFYNGFRNWLKDNGYGFSALQIYGAAARMAIGYLQKQYWTIDPEADIERVEHHMQAGYRAASTQADYHKGLRKLAEYIRLRCHRPKQERPIPWEYTCGSLSPRIQEQLHEFLTHCQRAWKPEHRFERSRDILYAVSRPLRWMEQHMGVRDLTELSPNAWLAWVDHRLLQDRNPVTINAELSALKHLAWFVRESGGAVCERFLLVKPLKAPWRMPRDVPVEQLKRLQAVFQAQANAPQAGKRRIGQMDLAWFLLMLHGGLRTCEVRYLKLGDINWNGQRIQIEQSKGLKDRQIFLDSAVLGALEGYLQVRGQREALPENVFIFRHAPLSRSYCFQRLETYGLRCGVKASPHQLRHSCATLLLNAGAPVLSVQMILGHKQIDTTLGYARLYDGTLAADYFSAMSCVERQLALPEDETREPPRLGELIALADALRSGSLNPRQSEIARALREGLGLLEVVKVR